MFNPELAVYALMLGALGYAVGRLVALDTVLDPLRVPLLRLVGGRKLPALIEYERMGVEPAEGEFTWPTNPVRRYLVDGLTCPSCMGWWVIVIYHLALSPVELAWRLDALVMFAGWGLTGALARKAG